jgi:hypothetical protein
MLGAVAGAARVVIIVRRASTRRPYVKPWKRTPSVIARNGIDGAPAARGANRNGAEFHPSP